ncbi:hypothetical protein BTJ40_07965 [Microbulbifer sp. A4B17]|nr:hypothetical protein BTJ40_07965 [Microbulbifer sp. A4B17]
MALLASLGNGHNFIVPTHFRNGSFNKLPFQLYWFNDGIFIVDADTEYKHLIGKKLISVANQPIDAVMKKFPLQMPAIMKCNNTGWGLIIWPYRRFLRV